jgi:hypothetical protein
MCTDPNGGDRINSFALVSYLPNPLAAFLDSLRQHLVPNCFLRAHVTVLPPRPLRVPPKEAFEQVCSLAANFQPFEIELAGVDVFPVSDVVHITIGKGREELQALHEALNRGGLWHAEPYPYHPHITLAQDLKPDELDELARVARERWDEFPNHRTFQVDALTFVQNTRCGWIDLGEHRLSEYAECPVPVT